MRFALCTDCGIIVTADATLCDGCASDIAWLHEPPGAEDGPEEEWT